MSDNADQILGRLKETTEALEGKKGLRAVMRCLSCGREVEMTSEAVKQAIQVRESWPTCCEGNMSLWLGVDKEEA